jgi:hypothetical protein
VELWSSALGGHAVCACHSIHGRLQSVVTGDFPSNGVHVRIADLYFELVFTTHSRCTSGVRCVMQYQPPHIWRAFQYHNQFRSSILFL